MNKKAFIAAIKKNRLDRKRATLEKILQASENALQAYLRGEFDSVFFTPGNDKTGPIFSVNTLPLVTCPARAWSTCAPYCYAIKNCGYSPSALKRYAENTVLYDRAPARYFSQLQHFCRGLAFFRYHCSGDIVNGAYFAYMVETARAVPGCKFLAFTKRWEIVNAWIRENGGTADALPENLQIIFSAEKNLRPVNPYNLPIAYMIADGEPVPDFVTSICTGYCYSCCCDRCGCWYLQPGDVVGLHEH